MISAHEVNRKSGSGDWEPPSACRWQQCRQNKQVRKLRDLIWLSNENDIVLNNGGKGGVRVHNLCCHLPSMVYGWFASFLFPSFGCGNHRTLFSLFSEPLMLSPTVGERSLDILKTKLFRQNLKNVHFALNVEKYAKTGVVTISHIMETTGLLL